jgi:hypothetical protein
MEEPDPVKILLSYGLKDSFSFETNQVARLCLRFDCHSMKYRMKIRAMPRKFTGFTMSGYSASNTLASSLIAED